MRYELGSLWRSKLRSHFQIVESYAEIMSHVTCGTHVHVSPGGSEWTLDQVRNVSRSILYFEEAFELLLPPDRRANPQCVSNRIENPKLRHLPDLDTCCQKIHECTTIEALVHLMNANVIDAKNWYGGVLYTDRRYGFNFENLLGGGLRTIGMPSKLESILPRVLTILRQYSESLPVSLNMRTVSCGQNLELLSC